MFSALNFKIIMLTERKEAPNLQEWYLKSIQYSIRFSLNPILRADLNRSILIVIVQEVGKMDYNEHEEILIITTLAMI